MHIKSGDNVTIITGKDKGKSGKILKAFPRENMVVVEGVNIKKRHQKARQEGKSGQIVETAYPVNASNVRLSSEAPKGDKPKTAKKPAAKKAPKADK